ncbi:hypothetical protein EV359DRAFT_76948 [Lentinula novae-zelandiae]|nr:hypothetical protein EV359DRAFT_76948 [Lentinula novae-zelandiae]
MVRQNFLALLAVSSAVVAHGAVVAIQRDAFNDITADAASLFGDATSKANSAFQVATSMIGSAFGHTSLPSGFVQTVTSDAGHIESIITSLGGEAITLASSGQGVVTSFAGTHFTIATSSPTPTASSGSSALATSSPSSGFVTSATSRPVTSTSSAAPSSTASQKNSAGSVQFANKMTTMVPIAATLAALVGSVVAGAFVNLDWMGFDLGVSVKCVILMKIFLSKTSTSTLYLTDGQSVFNNVNVQASGVQCPVTVRKIWSTSSRPLLTDGDDTDSLLRLGASVVAHDHEEAITITGSRPQAIFSKYLRT